MQLSPIFAVTGIFRIFITYGFWQGVRNGHPQNQQFFGSDHLIMNFIKQFNSDGTSYTEGDLASWFNLCALIWFFSGMFLEVPGLKLADPKLSGPAKLTSLKLAGSIPVT